MTDQSSDSIDISINSSLENLKSPVPRPRPKIRGTTSTPEVHNRTTKKDLDLFDAVSDLSDEDDDDTDATPLFYRKMLETILSKIIENQDSIFSKLENLNTKTDNLSTKIEELEDQQAREKNVKVAVSPYCKNLRKSGYNEGTARNLSWNLENANAYVGGNEKLSAFIKKHMYGLDETLSDDTIHAAIENYYISKKTMKKKGSESETSKASAALKQRKINKLKRRTEALAKNENISKQKKAKLMKVFKTDYMSSEEECEDENDDRYFQVRPLPWRSLKLSNTFAKLDAAQRDTQNKRSKNQTTRREEGEPSLRQPSINAPPFALEQQQDDQ